MQFFKFWTFNLMIKVLPDQILLKLLISCFDLMTFDLLTLSLCERD
jgi:hypothetical protein